MKTITRIFKLGILSVVLLFSSFNVKSQNPTNGGFEDGSTGWTLTPIGSYTPSVVSIEPRTGSNHLQINYSASSADNNGTVSSAINIQAGQYYHIIGWAKRDANNGTFAFNVSGAVSETPSATTFTPTNTYARYTRKSNATSLPNTITGTYQIIIRTKSAGSGNMYFDDIVSYASNNSTTDIIAPSPATGLTVTGNVLSWTEGTDVNTGSTGVQATYILRTNVALASAPVLNDQAAYAATNTVGDWTVIGIVNVGTTTYTDATGGSGYSYAIVHRDLAYNNSVATTVTNGGTTGVNTASKPTAQVFVNAQNELVINAPENSNYYIYNLVGMLLKNGVLSSNNQTSNFKLQTGIYMVKVNNNATKVIVK